MTKVVIMGAGIGGVSLAYEIRAKKGKWVHLAKVAFEKYHMRKVRTGSADPIHEKYILRLMGIEKLKS